MTMLMRAPVHAGSATPILGRGLREIVDRRPDVVRPSDNDTHADVSTDDSVAFQHVMTDVATRLVDTDPNVIEEVVVECLGRIGEALRLDRVFLWRAGQEDAPFSIAAIPFVASKLQAGEAVWFDTVEVLPNQMDRDTFRRLALRSAALLPLADHGNEVNGSATALVFGSTARPQTWAPAMVERLRLAAAVVSQALAREASREALQRVRDEIDRLRSRSQARCAELRRDLKVERASNVLVLNSVAVRRAVAQAEQVAPTTATVLLRGETGTGKEIFAKAIHDMSPRNRRPMVVVNCAAIPSALLESELFGRERGAYTGALSRQIGRFEAAHESTLFLDEIGDLPVEMQIKLLRVIQERVIERLGSTQPIKVDVRIIAATHCDLDEAVQQGKFREDLFYRLNVFPIHVPPLRERVEDIQGLVWAFVDEFSRAFGKTIDSVSEESMQELQRYPWPGNIRELRNIVERAVILCPGRQLVIPTPRTTTVAGSARPRTLAAFEVEHIRSVLEGANWRVRGPGGAAERLGLKPTTLESRMARLGIARKQATPIHTP